MDTTTLLSCIQRELSLRKGVSALAFQNHLYGCFIVMEDLAQGILDEVEGSLTGNSLYLNLDTQFGQIGIRYYGFVMDGKAVLDDAPDDYKEAWRVLFRGVRGAEAETVDRVEDEVIAIMREAEDGYFLNALEHDGSLSADYVEKVVYLLHPELQGQTQQGQTTNKKEGKGSNNGKSKRRLAVTRRQNRAPSRARWPLTRRQKK